MKEDVGQRTIFDGDEAEAKRWREGEIIGRAKERLQAAFDKALSNGVPFCELLKADVADTLCRNDFRCVVSGMPFDLEAQKSGAGGSYLAPSPDRINPDGGYVRGNVRWTNWAVNQMRGRMPDEVFIQICRAVAKANPERRA